ncbi:MAG TPA: MBL fold metallo-hydrolase [Gemmatimonadales bacterium]|nr:MBL fold metallo-hydrolase [Gemmatimonadales bacterium]
MLKWKFSTRFGIRPRETPPPTVRPDIPKLDRSALGLTWVGHATFLVQTGGMTLLTDPMWSERASPVAFAGPRRVVSAALPFDELPPIDLVLISHNHYDHLDSRTVRRLAQTHPRARWVVPLGLSTFVRQRGVADVRELDWWETATEGPLEIGCTPAQHFSARTMADRNRSLWCGFTVRAAGRRLYFAGDTAYHPEFARIAERFGPFDAALLPIGAYEPRWFMRVVHMNPADAVQAFIDLRRGAPATRLMVGMHWGTFRLADEPVLEPPIRVRDAWRAAGLASEDLWVPVHGESRVI